MSSLVFSLVFSLGPSLRIYRINSQNTMRNTFKRYEKCVISSIKCRWCYEKYHIIFLIVLFWWFITNYPAIYENMRNENIKSFSGRAFFCYNRFSFSFWPSPWIHPFSLPFAISGTRHCPLSSFFSSDSSSCG